MGSTIVVEEGEAAVFVVKDRALDGFGPGRHILTTASVPLVTRFSKLPYGASSSFEAALFFVDTGHRADQRWGTRFAVAFHDNMLGVVRVRGYGSYGVTVTNAPLFLNTLLRRHRRGPQLDVEGSISELISTRLADFLSERLDTIIDLPKYAREATNSIGLRLATEFQRRGAELTRFEVSGLTVPDEVLAKLEVRSTVSAVRALCQFFLDQVALSIEVPPPDRTQEFPGVVTAPTPSAGDRDAGKGSSERNGDSEGGARCRSCYSISPVGGRFCATCGDPFSPLNPCLHCGQENAPDACYCHRCGVSLSDGFACPSCTAELPVGCRYCMACGNPTGGR
jgi:membrane protease subunit (stomatin/prohibitin family)